MSNKVLLAGGASHVLLANGSDFLLLALSDSVAVQSTPFLNVPTQRRPFLGRTHVSQMRGTEDVRGRRGGNALRPYLRKQRQSHYYPGLTEVPAVSDNAMVLQLGGLNLQLDGQNLTLGV